MTYSDTFLHDVLKTTKCIACVGVSPNPVRPSYFVFRYMQLRRFRMIPVNPVAAGTEILGEPVYGDLSEIPSDTKVDMVDIFRNSDAAGGVIDEAIAIGAKAVWTQLDVINRPAAERAVQAGLDVVMDRCPKIEIPRLGLLKAPDGR